MHLSTSVHLKLDLIFVTGLTEGTGLQTQKELEVHYFWGLEHPRHNYSVFMETGESMQRVYNLNTVFSNSNKDLSTSHATLLHVL